MEWCHITCFLLHIAIQAIYIYGETQPEEYKASFVPEDSDDEND